MKRMLCMILSLVMALSLAVPAFATVSEDNGNGSTLDTDVTYLPEDTDGDGDVDGDDDKIETYTVVVPANVAVNGTGTVTITGKWASNRQLTVTPDATVALKCTGSADKVLAVSMNTTVFAGSNTEAISKTATVSVANWSVDVPAPLFGTWKGTFNYTVAMSDVA